MKSFRVVCATLALTAVTCCAALADDAAPKITISGLIDWYAQYSFNHPSSGASLSGRSFDVKQGQFALSLGEVNIVKPTSEASPLGFTATLTAGKTADLVHATEPGGTNTYRHIQQLYGTYVLPGKLPVTVDAGKFVTAMGAEVIESSANDNYSRSFLFTYAIPFYHAGLRLTAPITPTLTGQLQIVNGWNNVEDDNAGLSLGGQLNYKPCATVNVILNAMTGDESTGAALPANLNVQTYDLVATYQATPKLKLTANADYASASKPGTSGGTWSGTALYAKYQVTPKTAAALRYEHFEDSAGLRTGTAQNLHSLTATYEYVVKDSLVNRIELRHDTAGTAFFPSGSGASTKQDTITFGQVFKF